nr:hypothetical protein BaRGS_028170 [Batillaria attramentaria]
MEQRREAKPTIHNQYQTQWKRRLGADSGVDPIHLLQRHWQTILSRTPEHINAALPMMLYAVKPGLRAQGYRSVQLWDSSRDLEKTVGFVMATGLHI